MSKWSLVAVMVLLVLTSAMGLQALANSSGPMPPSPWANDAAHALGAQQCTNAAVALAGSQQQWSDAAFTLGE